MAAAEGRAARAKGSVSAHRGSVFAGHHSSAGTSHVKNAAGLIHVDPAYLMKRSTGVLGRWQRRWFSLSNNYLLYAKTEADADQAHALRALGGVGVADEKKKKKKGKKGHQTSIDLRLIEAVTEGVAEFEFQLVMSTAGALDEDEDETELTGGDGDDIHGPGVNAAADKAAAAATKGAIFRIKCPSRRDCERWMNAVQQRRNYAVGGNAPLEGVVEVVTSPMSPRPHPSVATIAALERIVDGMRAEAELAQAQRDAAEVARAEAEAARDDAVLECDVALRAARSGESALLAARAEAESVAELQRTVSAASMDLVASAVASATATVAAASASDTASPPAEAPRAMYTGDTNRPRDAIDDAVAVARGEVGYDASKIGYTALVAASLARTVAQLRGELAEAQLDVARAIALGEAQNYRPSRSPARAAAIALPPTVPRKSPMQPSTKVQPSVRVNRHGSVFISN